MKKLLALLTVASMIALTACGGSSSSSSTATTAAATTAAETAEAVEEDSGEEAGSGETVEIEDSYNWNVAMNVTETTLNYKMMDKFKELIEDRSGGKITVNLYANGQLGNDTEQMQGLIEGQNDFVTGITSGMPSFVKEYAVFDCPNVFPNLETMRAVLADESFVDALNVYSTPANIRLMGMTDAGFRQTTANREIHEVSDFSGLKIRVIQNPYYITYWESLGGNAVGMDFNEVFVALQQKIIDAEENPYMNIVANKFYECQDYVIETNHLGHIIVFLMNEPLYQSLPANVQQLVDECAKEAIEYTTGLADDSIAEDKQTVIDSGTTIIELDDSVIEQMKEAAEDVYAQIRADIGDELVDKLMDSVEANRK